MPDRHGPENRESSRSRRALQVMRSRVQPGSFPLLLAALVLNYVLNGLDFDSSIREILVLGARIGVAAAGMYVLSANRVMLWLGVVVVALLIAFEAQLWGFNPWVNRVVQDAMSMTFVFWILVVVLRDVFRSSTTELNAVIGALCGFVLILTLFMRLHGLIEAVNPGSYRAEGPSLSENSGATMIAIFQYFSTVTLTTVGFGDIVPVAPVARLATGAEAVIGQLYLAVVIATLVGRVAARRH